MASAPVLKTTVTQFATAVATAIPRVSVSRDLQRANVIPGARLMLRTADNAPRPARVTRSVRSVRHADLGAIVPRSVAGAISQIEEAATGKGAVLRSGVTHLWEVPANRVAALQISSDMPVRVAFLSSAATRIADAEYGNAHQLNLQIPANCGMVAITGLGVAAGGAADKIAGGLSGAVTGALAPPGSRPIVGWQVGMHVAQAGASVLLARGASIVLSQLTGVSLGNQAMSLGMIALSAAMVDQVAIQTYLPPDIGVVGILLDAKAGAAIGPETVVVAADNATLSAVPIRVDGGDRTLFLYDVTHAPGAAPKDTVITVATAGDFHLAGVLGMRGTAKNWGAELNGGVLAASRARCAALARRSGHRPLRHQGDSVMPSPAVGEMILYDYIKPSLLDGEYRMHVETDVNLSNAPQALEARDAFFNVEGPRFALLPTEVSGVFPPRNGHGVFDGDLPHIALGRRTLPWERVLGQSFTASADGTPLPVARPRPLRGRRVRNQDQPVSGRRRASRCLQSSRPPAECPLRLRRGR